MPKPVTHLAAMACVLSLCSTALAAPAPHPKKVTATPIRHLVVIYQENVSFDHYFATYPNATNPAGEPAFVAQRGTPGADTLIAAGLLENNANNSPANGADAAAPFRLDRSQAATSDQNHDYTAEQMAYDHGRADLFPRYTGTASPGGVGAFHTRGQVMGYFDGNTVTAFWRYAQRYAMSDAFYTDTYGPSTPGALEVVSGQTNGMMIKKTTQHLATREVTSPFISDGQGGFTMINDIDPADDVCSTPSDQVWMAGQNIGDLLNAAHITWGGFMGGFDLSVRNTNATTGCGRSTFSPTVSQSVVDYIPHHNWFQYFPSTANPTHARPSSTAAIGHSLESDGKSRDPANHEYDLKDFLTAVRAGNMPAVSFLKLPAFQDGHAGYSNPLDEQAGIVGLVNFIQSRPEWKETAIIITYDDSDGWYDHAFVAPAHGSFDPEADQLDGPGRCGTAPAPLGVTGKPVNGRCGPGTRVPLLVLSPWARRNYIGHTLITQSSITRFIEDNWLNGQRLGKGSFDETATPLDELFNFRTRPDLAPLFLTPDKADPTSRKKLAL
ncbi:alkaline phosphatase family protein [Acetobacter sp. TBRC 12305]|uniref:Alkaline phosphatase family protein n=1 Tax=Acetobacter garciniae TaxID=2817435 RepID=A0A939HK88_9PROT|nr:alkaline phosphatase family protein [Acetobacter garciniae]MBO1324285.1 alkaline phosphatase family protein [Acetobacter garciniae]MBX0343974.1 alkaline phosphatase family protein [Acetobacter garciniae]